MDISMRNKVEILSAKLYNRDGFIRYLTDEEIEKLNIPDSVESIEQLKADLKIAERISERRNEAINILYADKAKLEAENIKLKNEVEMLQAFKKFYVKEYCKLQSQDITEEHTAEIFGIRVKLDNSFDKDTIILAYDEMSKDVELYLEQRNRLAKIFKEGVSASRNMAIL